MRRPLGRRDWGLAKWAGWIPGQRSWAVLQKDGPSRVKVRQSRGLWRFGMLGRVGGLADDPVFGGSVEH